MEIIGDEVNLTPATSPELTKRSWFGTLMGSERDETYTILVKGKPLASVKADLIHAFLSVSSFAIHSIENTGLIGNRVRILGISS